MTRLAPRRPDLLPGYQEPFLSGPDAEWSRFMSRKRMVDTVVGFSPIGEETEPEDAFVRRRLEEIAGQAVGVAPTRQGTPEDPEADAADAEMAGEATRAPAKVRSWAHEYLRNVDADKAQRMSEIETQRAQMAAGDGAQWIQRGGEYLESGVHPRAAARAMREHGWSDAVVAGAYLQNIEDNIQTHLDTGDFEAAQRLRIAKMQAIRFGGAVDPNGPEIAWGDRYLMDSLRAQAGDMGGAGKFTMAAANAIVDSARMVRRFAGAQNPGDRDVMEMMAQVLEEEGSGAALAGGLVGSFLDPGWYAVGAGVARGGAAVLGRGAGAAAIRQRFATAMIQKGAPESVAMAAAARLTPETQAMHRIGQWASGAMAKRGVAMTEAQAQTTGRIMFRALEGAIGNAAVEAGIAYSKDRPITEILAAAGIGAGFGVAFGVGLDRLFAGASGAAKLLRRAGDVEIPPGLRAEFEAEAAAARELGIDDETIDTFRETTIGAMRDANEFQRAAGRPLTEQELRAILAERGIDLSMRRTLAERREAETLEQARVLDLMDAQELAGGTEFVQRIGGLEQDALETEIRGYRSAITGLKTRPIAKARTVEAAPGSGAPFPVSEADQTVRRGEAIGRLEARQKVAEEVYRRRFGQEAPAGGRLSPTLPDGPEAAQVRLDEIERTLFGPEMPERDRALAIQEFTKLQDRLTRPLDAGLEVEMRERLATLRTMLTPDVPLRDRMKLIDEYEALRAQYPVVTTRGERAMQARQDAERAAREASKAAKARAETAAPPPTVATTGAASQTVLGDLGRDGRYSKADVLTYISSFGEQADILADLIDDVPHVVVRVPMDAIDLQLVAGDEAASLASGELTADKLEASRDFPAESMPPVVGRVDNGRVQVLDGTHRTVVARGRGQADVEVLVPEEAARAAGWLVSTESGRTVSGPEKGVGATSGAPMGGEQTGSGAPNRLVLHTMGPDEARAALEAAKSEDRGILERVFGPEGAKKYRRLERTANGDGPNASSAADKMAAMEAALDDAQRNLLYGIGEDPGPSVEELQLVADFLERVEVLGTEEELGASLRMALIELGPEGRTVELDTAPARMQAAAAAMRLAHQTIVERGLDPVLVSRAAIKAAADLFPDPEDAAYMLHRFLVENGRPADVPRAATGLEGASASPIQAAPAPPVSREPLRHGTRTASLTTNTLPPMTFGDPPVAMGRQKSLELPDGRSIPVRYGIVSASELVPSHDPRKGFEPNPLGDVNERDYRDPTEGKASRETVERIAKEPKTDLLLTDSPSATDGPPIVRPNGVVLGGNARTMAQQLAYSRNREAAASLRAATLDRAEAFGVDRAVAEGIADPVLVRIVDDADAGDPGELSRILNQPLTTAKSSDTDAVSRGRQLKPSDIDAIATILGEDTVREALNDPARATRILHRLVESGAFGEADTVQLLNVSGGFTAAGKDTVERTLLGAAVPDIRRIAQSSPAARNKLLRVLPSVMRLRSARHNGASIDFDADLIAALDAAYALRESGALSFTDLVTQTSMFPEAWRDNTRAIGVARSLVEDTPTTFERKLRELAKAAEMEASGQSGLFAAGASPAQNTVDVYTANFPAPDAADAARKAAGPAGLFGSGRRGGLADIDPPDAPDATEMAGVAPSRGNSPYTQGLPIMVGSATGKLQRVPPVLNPVPMPELLKLATAIMGRPPLVRRLGGARGMFKHANQSPKSGAIFIDPATAGDAEGLARTLAHEIGHLIDFMDDGDIRRGNLIGRVKSLAPTISNLGQVRGFMRNTFGNLSNRELREELIDLSMYWKPWARSTPPSQYDLYRTSSVELYADALSVWLNSPGLFEQKAPKFARALYDAIDAKPKVLDAYLSIQDFLGGTSAEIAAGRRADIREGFAKGEEIIKARAAEKEASRVSLIQAVRQALFDRGAPVIDREKALKRRGITIPEAQSAELVLDELQYRDAAVHVLLEGIDTEVHRPIVDAGMTRDDAGEYLLLRRISTERAEIANPYGHVPETALAQLDDLKARLGPEKVKVLEAALTRFDDIVYDVAQRAAQSGIINATTFDEIITPNKGQYATFAVLDYLDTTMSAGVRQQVGTFKEVADPFLATTMKAMAQVRAIELNNAKAAIRDSWRVHIPDDMKLVRTAPGEDPPRPGFGRDHLVIMENGRPAFYETDAYVAKAFGGNDIGHLARIGKAISGKTYGIFHPLYVTFSPSWQVTNLPRDIRRTHKNLPIIKAYDAGLSAPSFREVLKAYVDASPAAWRRASRQPDPTVTAMLEARALDVPFASYDWNVDATAYENQLRRYGMGDTQQARTKLGQWAGNLLNQVERVGVWTESLPKVATWNMLARRGVDPKIAGHVVRNYVGTPNFKRKGTATELTNGIWMYSNVIVQGLRADARVATTPRSAGGYWMRSLMLDFLPKMAMRAAALGVFGAGLKAIFDLIPDYDLANHVVIPLGVRTADDGSTKAVYLRLPHDDANRMLAIGTWLLSRGLPREAVAGMLGQLPFTSLSPPIDMMAQWAQFAMGRNPYDTFRHREIVGRDAWNAGGWHAAQDMVRWTLDEFGIASVVADGISAVATAAGEAVGVDTEPVTGLFTEPGRETVPVVWERIVSGLPGIERILKVSDRGLTEAAWESVALEDAERARLRLSLPANARNLVRQRYSLNRLGDERIDGARRYRRQVLNDFYRRVYLPVTKELQVADQENDDRRADALRKTLEREANNVVQHLRNPRGRGSGDPADRRSDDRQPTGVPVLP